MTGESYNRAPVAVTVTRGNPIVQVEKILTAAAKPGHLMQIDGNDYKTKKQASGYEPCGWLSYENTNLKTRKETPDDAYASGDVVGIVAGGNFELYAHITCGTTADLSVSIGDKLIGNNDGTLRPWVAGTDTGAPVAVALESLTVTHGTSAIVKRIHVLSLI